MKFASKIIAVLGLLTLPVLAMAQPGGNGLVNDNMEMTNEYEPNLSALEKPPVEVPGTAIKGDKREVEYEEVAVQAETEYEPLKPSVGKPPKEKWPALKNNFLKLGYGRFGTPMAQLHLTTGRKLNARAGLDFSHISSSNGYLDYTEFREDRGGITGEYYTRTNTMKGHFRMDNVNYFYFADSLASADRPDLKDSIRMTYTRLDVGGSLASNFDPEGINYDVGLQFEGYFDRYDNRELNISILPKLNWKVVENFYANINSQLTLTSFKFDSLDQNKLFLDFTPSVTYKKDRLTAQAGLKVNSYADSTSQFRAYPHLTASYALIEDKLTGSAGLVGGMDYNRWYDLIEVNPYLNRVPHLRPSSNPYHFFVGLDANLGKYFTASVNGYSKRVKDKLIFATPEEGAYFDMVYDSSFTETGSEIALLFNKDDKIRAGIRGSFRNFDTTNVAANFGIPTSQIDLFGSYNFANKVWVATEIYLYGKRTMSIDSSGAPIVQNFAADVNLSADYRFSNRISIFLELNNLLGTTYSNWHNYQVRPFDVKAGATLSF